MVKYFDEIPKSLIKWLTEQKTFWIATAPLAEDGLINLSPKGLEGTFHVISPTKVWYEDITGTGVATIAHVRENGRITVLFNAFEGPPRILRLYGRGTVYEFGTPEYEELLPPEKREAGSRSIIMIDVFKVATSCGFGVPFYAYRGPRNKLRAVSRLIETVDVKGQVIDLPTDETLGDEEVGAIKRGLKSWWRTQNAYSVDGLPAVMSAFDSETQFCLAQGELAPDDESTRGYIVVPDSGRTEKSGWVKESDMRVILAFFAGALFATSYFAFLRDFMVR